MRTHKLQLVLVTNFVRVDRHCLFVSRLLPAAQHFAINVIVIQLHALVINGFFGLVIHASKVMNTSKPVLSGFCVIRSGG